jgi:hypothetical protein
MPATSPANPTIFIFSSPVEFRPADTIPVTGISANERFQSLEIIAPRELLLKRSAYIFIC